MNKYAHMTDDDFDNILEELVGKMSAGEILGIGAVNLILREELNNEVLDIWESTHPSPSVFPVTYVAADTANGCYKIDPVDFPDMDLLSIDDFISWLPTLTNDDGVIFTAFNAEDEDAYNELNEEYTIN